ncbi:hypothetical protein NC653_023821 [Populus alba x Populus x berolinensis]|uniref:EGF-like domain-containing protein n=1 Tax=Populus alba x Populus x berolinensis TaxID=444605 RepID=A0AAD6MKL7_9ROSI|nr:hypothetical protein NC653_023821 [Populus alba x Populus x berolinensis]
MSVFCQTRLAIYCLPGNEDAQLKISGRELVMMLQRWVFLLMMLLLVAAVTGATANPDVRDGCQERCGDVIVPYPFGIGEQRCAMNANFFLNCTSADELWFGENMPARNISLLNGTLTVGIDTSFDCYDKSGLQSGLFNQSISLGSGPFTFSDSRNVFTAVGCDTIAMVINDEDKDSLDLSDWPLSRTSKLNDTSNVVIEWVAQTEKCEKAQANKSSYACGMNTNCNYSDNGQGYRCECEKGFEGNPYLEQGCQDIDECKDPQKYTCHGKCHNTIGDYKCKCSLGMHGDGKVGCQGFAITTIIAEIQHGVVVNQ